MLFSRVVSYAHTLQICRDWGRAALHVNRRAAPAVGSFQIVASQIESPLCDREAPSRIHRCTNLIEAAQAAEVRPFQQSYRHWG